MERDVSRMELDLELTIRDSERTNRDPKLSSPDCMRKSHVPSLPDRGS
jgi:hypothetical protein